MKRLAAVVVVAVGLLASCGYPTTGKPKPVPTTSSSDVQAQVCPPLC